MNYAATRFENDGEYSEVLEAATWAEAEEICNANGWHLDGEIVHTGIYDADHPLPSMGVH